MLALAAANREPKYLRRDKSVLYIGNLTVQEKQYTQNDIRRSVDVCIRV